MWPLRGSTSMAAWRPWSWRALLVLCLTFALLFREVRRICPNVLIAFGATVAAIAGSSMHWLARPHLFTFLFVVVFWASLERAREGRPVGCSGCLC